MKGDASTLVQTCQLTEYCEAATGTCKTKVCTAEHARLQRQGRTTSATPTARAFLVGGTDCSPKYCNAGACVDYLFREDFEDGDLLGWTTGTGHLHAHVSRSTTAAAGYHLQPPACQDLPLPSVSNDGIYQVFGSPLAPSAISWYVRIALPYSLCWRFRALLRRHRGRSAGPRELLRFGRHHRHRLPGRFDLDVHEVLLDQHLVPPRASQHQLAAAHVRLVL